VYALADPQIYVLLLRQDDPRKCTAARLTRFGVAKPLYRIRQIPHDGLMLNPMASRVILPNDRNRVTLKLIAIDCSWERAQTIFSRRLPGLGRRLPTLLAANPTNYSKRCKLTSAEALAAASYILGFKEVAVKLLSLFKWGNTFLTLNNEPLNEYSLAVSEREMIRAESDFF